MLDVIHRLDFPLFRGMGRCLYLPQCHDGVVYDWMWFMTVQLCGRPASCKSAAPYLCCRGEISPHSLLIVVYGASTLFIKM